MALTPRLEMRQGQSLVMTPQLQQAIKLLQFSAAELAEFVEGELERNPLLERIETEPDEAARESETRDEAAAPMRKASAKAAARPTRSIPARGRARIGRKPARARAGTICPAWKRLWPAKNRSPNIWTTSSPPPASRPSTA
jgi:RNA polymerase sigma-54 factor